MNGEVDPIPLWNLGLSFLPVVIVVVILYAWRIGGGTTLYGMGRMLLQLLLVGYVLTGIFESRSAWLVMGVLALMLTVASWIALRPVRDEWRSTLPRALLSISLGGVPVLALITQVVLSPDPWFEPRAVIPLAGMIFANSMNSVSLAAERLQSEMKEGKSHENARKTALNASLIPLTNSLFAVGLVSLPGMMTGQILSGVEPLIAARYQIMVMSMLFGSAGISAACYLWLARTRG